MCESFGVVESDSRAMSRQTNLCPGGPEGQATAQALSNRDATSFRGELDSIQSHKLDFAGSIPAPGTNPEPEFFFHPACPVCNHPLKTIVRDHGNCRWHGEFHNPPLGLFSGALIDRVNGHDPGLESTCKPVTPEMIREAIKLMPADLAPDRRLGWLMGHFKGRINPDVIREELRRHDGEKAQASA